MNYYINGAGRRRTAWKIILCIGAYVLVFVLAFFISFKLASGTRADTAQIESLRSEVTALTAQIAEKDGEIDSLRMQVENVRTALEEMKKAAEELPRDDNAENELN